MKTYEVTQDMVDAQEQHTTDMLRKAGLRHDVEFFERLAELPKEVK